MRLGDNEWPDDIEKIIKKNVIRELISFLPLLGYILFFIFLTAKRYILAIVFFIIGVIIHSFSPREIKVAISDLIALHLYRLFINIEKFNGRNPHFKEEAKKELASLDMTIDDYISQKKNTLLIDFSQQINKEYLIRLHHSVKKIFCFFEEYDKYKEKQEELRRIVQKLAFSFHNNETFSEESYSLINELDKLDIPQKPIRIELKPLIKKYLLDNKVIYWIVFFLLFPLCVWYLPYYTPLKLSIENRLVIIIPVLAMALIQILTRSQKNTEKKKK